MSENETYSVRLMCNNCGEYWCPSVRKGRKWEDWIKYNSCPNCGCADASRVMQWDKR